MTAHTRRPGGTERPPVPAQDQSRGYVWFLESLDRVHRAIQRWSDMGEALNAALEVLLDVFACDRAFLVRSDPDAWSALLERTRPEYPGGLQMLVGQPVTAGMARLRGAILATAGAVQLGPEALASLEVPQGIAPPRASLAMAIRPKAGSPWVLGLHQCSHARKWGPEEERLFVEIGHRLADALTTLLAYRDLRETEQKVAQAHRVARLGYWERDVATYETNYSEETLRIFGLPADLRALEPERLAERLHPEDRHIMIEAYERAIAGGPRYDVDYRVVRPDGEVRYVHSEGDVTWDADGRPLRMFGTMQDITERKRTEERLARYRDQLAELASEQAALRRVATLVARGEPSSRVFEAVAEEVATLLAADLGLISRFDGEGAIVGVGEWSPTGQLGFLGMNAPLGGRNVTTLVYETHRPVRLDDYESVTGARAEEVGRLGLKSAIGAPITVAGRLWGVIAILSKLVNAFPPGTEHRLGEFAELLATAVANAEAQMELTASRARIVATADETRRRIERDLHDGAQQQLVSLVLRLRGAHSTVPPELHDLADELDAIATALSRTLDELRELARGIHPPVLTKRGLAPALRALARRSAVPVELDVQVEPRPPQAIEIATYYIVSEALTNAVKHAQASRITAQVISDAGALHIHVRDDGVGGANLARGSGLVGLKDRAAALGGRIDLRSERGAGTTLSVELPYAVDSPARLSAE